RTYADQATVAFEQEFPDGLENTEVTTDSPHDQLITCFPSFKQTPAVDNVNVLSFWEVMSQAEMHHSLKEFRGGINGGSPLVLFDQQLNTLVISPLSNFKVGYISKPKVLGGDVGSGIQGNVKSIPKNFKHETIIHVGTGITKTVLEWGSILLKKGGKAPTTVESSDIAIKTLGYWTDNGAYYYYLTENTTNNYEETITKLKQNHAENGLPYRNYQFDSWWYYQGHKNAVKLWEPRKDIFPSGMYKMSEITDSPLILHNRWWSIDNEYQKKYKFAVEKDMALPLEQAFWDDLMSRSRLWGVNIYEQDWLITQTKGMKVTQDNVHVASNWLTQMGRAAAKYGMTIQYCMSLPMDLLQSTLIQAVTHTRVSHDYKSHTNSWEIGRSSLLAWAVGLFPFKDVMVTTTNQPGEKRYYTGPEKNPELQTIISALSNGPIGIGDKMGYHNKELIMSTCNNDGILLKSDRPALAIDRSYLAANVKKGEIWETSSTVDGLQWSYLLAVNISSDFDVKMTDFYGASDYKSKRLLVDLITKGYQWFEPETQSIKLPKNIETKDHVLPFKYYSLAPLLKNDIVLLGELSKKITVSKQRFRSIDVDQNGVRVTLITAPQEKVIVTFLAGEKLIQAGCAAPEDGDLVIYCEKNGEYTCGRQ
ncbi:hypothetical protein AKO1_013847, partial [Acrasis kona]